MIVYCTVNLINGKKYIGSHIHNDDSYLGSGTNIKKAIKKYGRENFKRYILAEVENFEIMKELEEYYIDYYQAYESSLFYNATKYPAGITKFPEDKKLNVSLANKNNKYNLGRIQTEETKNKISQSNKGKKRSEEYKKIVSERFKGNTSRKGKPFSDENKEKISKSKINHPCYKDSERNKKISQANKGKLKGIKKSQELIDKMSKNRQKQIVQLDLNNNIINIFPSIKDARKLTGISYSIIINCCKGRTTTGKGYLWRYNNG